ncbi:MAG TPA: DUF5710 domain-containing protein [Rhodoferax sp.]|nr:DUF5710 domain-containing protein [Rhodoferax sp.]
MIGLGNGWSLHLATPFAEKDAVKALGARWDASKKCWYIVDMADLTPFARWIPNLAAALAVSGTTTQATKQKLNLPAPGGVSAPVNTQALIRAPANTNAGVADCGCHALPREDCVQSAKS